MHHARWADRRDAARLSQPHISTRSRLQTWLLCFILSITPADPVLSVPSFYLLPQSQRWSVQSINLPIHPRHGQIHPLQILHRERQRGAWQNDTTSLKSPTAIIITDNMNISFLPGHHHHQAGRLGSKIYLPNFSAACARSLKGLSASLRPAFVPLCPLSRASSPLIALKSARVGS